MSALRWVIIIVCWSFALSQVKAENLPDLAGIKLAAEKGDARAQDKLGEAYLRQFEYYEAAKWYRLAAEKGIPNSQYQLGEFLLNGRSSLKAGAPKVPQDVSAAIQWLYKAASQGHEGAQLELGHCYRSGKGVKVDYVEAYKWYSLATRNNYLVGRPYRDRLILKMTTAQVQEGQRLTEAFRPTQNPKPLPLKSPASLERLVLKGISGSSERRLAVINNKTFGIGEEQEIKVGKQNLQVKCYEIHENRVIVGLAGASERMELRLP